MKCANRVQIHFETTLTLTEAQANALIAIGGYGADEFLRVFYGRLGSHYLKPQEEGFKSLFKAVSEQLETPLANMAKIRDVARDIENGGRQ